jgi:aryl-alcohol dehydrogenase-like predicted oxidoreductase
VELRAFGRSGIDVPVIGMGTWRTFDASSERDQANATAVVDRALAAGTTLFDTSPMYGRSEEVLASALGARRDAVLIADKVWASSRIEGREQIDRALGWYGGRIDILQVHNLLAWEKHLPVLEELRQEGLIGMTGATHYKSAAYRELMSVMRDDRIGMIQIPYNPTDRAVEKHVLPLAEELGLGVMVMKPLGSGVLVGREPSAADLAPLAEFGVKTWAQALLKWVLSDTRVHCAIPATSRPGRAEENAAAGRPPWFDADMRDRVTRLATRLA